MTAPHLGAGHTVAGRYSIRSLIAFTGEVATYHAVTQQGQEVVLKLYDPAIGQRADVMSRLEQVRALVAAISPELVVPVIDSGYDVTTSAPFSVTELLRLHSLTQLVRAGPLPPGVVATIAHGIGRSLEAAHSRQLFHHALKPANIFVGPAPGYAVRIADFGASVVRSSSPTHEAYANAAPWWAPEQLQPAAVLGAATDVFAAALVAFYALTGRSYWMSCQASPPDLPGWQIEIMGQRTPVSQRAAELGAGISAAVDGVFARALSVNLLDRPRSVSEIANALGAAGGMQEERGPKTVALPELAYQQSAVAQQSGHTVMGEMISPMAGGAYAPAPQVASAGGYAGNPAAGGYGAAPAPVHAEPAQTPGLPPYPHPVKTKKSGAMLPVIIGVAAAVVLGGIGVGFLLLSGGDDDSDSDVAATPSATTTTASEDDGGEKPVATANATGQDGAGGAAGAPDAGGDEPDAGTNDPEKVEVLVSCEPACDVILVDNKPIEKPDEKLELLPGKHVIKLVKSGYAQRVEVVEIESGKPFEKSYPLVRINAQPVPLAPKPCGQFLRPCR